MISTTLTYATMVPVSSTEELLKMIDSKNYRCKMTVEQLQKVEGQVIALAGTAEGMAVSQRGIVFSQVDGEIYCIGRIDAAFNFYPKL